MDVVTYAASKKYTDDSLEGVGAIAGKPCQIESIEPITGGNKVTYLWEDNSGTEHTQSMNVMNGQKGDTGERGEVGETGATGATGRTATIAVGTVVSGDSPAVTNVGTQNDGVFNFVLPKGDKGDRGEKGNDGADGKSFDIKAQYPTYDALIAAHPTGEAGDAYFVGTDENPDLYIWLTDDQEWFNNGKIAGVKGDKGDTGDDGFSPVASVSKVGKVATITIRDKVGQTTATVSDGEDGVDAQYETLPSASATNEGRICQYIGETSGSLKNGHFYKCVEESGSFYWVELFGSSVDKDAGGLIRPSESRLVDGNAVYSAINNALSSVYTARGNITVAELTSSILIEANVGNVYELSDSGTTTDLFLQGAGVPLAVGDNVGIIKAGASTYLFNKMAGAFDLTDYQKKDLAQAIEGATTVEGALGALSDNKQAKTLTTSVESSNTVEGALGALSTNKATQAEVNDIVNVLGAKNLLPNNAVSQTTNGVTFTVNSDGSVTANGTASENTWLWFVSYAQGGFYLPAGRYIINGSEQEASDTYNWSVYVTIAGESSNLASDWGHDTDGVVFENTSASNNLISAIWIKSGAVLNNALFKPMIRLASDPDNTYEPYAMTNQQLTPYAQSISNPNLFDNPWFTVNQRGLTTYTTPTSDRKYTVDRWSINIHLSATVDSNGITLTSDNSGINGDLRHGFENSMYPFLVNRLATLSAKLSDGTIYSISGIINPAQIGTIRLPLKDGWKIDINTGSNGTIAAYIFSDINNPNSSITIRAVKLELGGVSTLAMDTAPNYATELLKCQRYFVRIKGYPSQSNINTLLGIGIGFTDSTNVTAIKSTVIVPTTMRQLSPLMTISSVSDFVYETGNASSRLEATSVSALTGCGNVMSYYIRGTSITNGQTYYMNLKPNAYIDFSADL